VKAEPEWTEEALQASLAAHSPDFDWLVDPGRHQYRWRALDGRWLTAQRRVKDHSSLLKATKDSVPLDIYISTSTWLEPIDLPRLKEKTRPPPILLDHLIVFDIDMRPFSRRRLESARLAAVSLRDWIKENTDLNPLHISFSGSKGFHLVYTEPDRSLFAIPDPREREKAVRASRKILLRRVIENGHPVDPLITADTRRIIRLPGTLHGRTGWYCSRLNDGQIDEPLRVWVDDLPRHSLAINLPKRVWKIPSFRIPWMRRVALPKEILAEHGTCLQVSSHVPETKNRSVLMTWINAPSDKIGARIERLVESMDEADIGPCAVWSDSEGALILIPRAIPRDAFRRITLNLNLAGFGHGIRRHGHVWERISAVMWDQSEWSTDLVAHGVYAIKAGERCQHPWSKAHLELASRMGLFIQSTGDLAGSSEPITRIVRMR